MTRLTCRKNSGSTNGRATTPDTLEAAQLALVRQLQARTVKRTYLALVRGKVEAAGTIDKPIGPCADDHDAGSAKCDPTLVCGQALTCVNGHLYPTTCGPDNCDKPGGPCQ